MSAAAAVPIGDRLAILDLYARQSHAIDGGDALEWARTFTSEGRFESPTFQLTAVGPDELAAFAERSNRLALDRGEQLRHWTNSLILEPVGPDEVRVRGYLLIVATSVEATRVDRSLVIHDTLVRTPDGWLFASRIVFRDPPAGGADAGRSV